MERVNYIIGERTGDRGMKSQWTFKPFSFCIPSNPMSDRGQVVFVIYED
jgi:hypothetical protein